MNKNMAGILGAAAVLTMLAGCTAYDRAKDQFVQPVVKDVKKGMSRVIPTARSLPLRFPTDTGPGLPFCPPDSAPAPCKLLCSGSGHPPGFYSEWRPARRRDKPSPAGLWR